MRRKCLSCLFDMWRLENGTCTTTKPGRGPPANQPAPAPGFAPDAAAAALWDAPLAGRTSAFAVCLGVLDAFCTDAPLDWFDTFSDATESEFCIEALRSAAFGAWAESCATPACGA